MRKTMSAAVAAMAILCAAATPALAKPDLITGADPKALFDVLLEFGPVQLTKAQDGAPTIFGEMEGLRYGAKLYGCNSGRGCTDLSFFALFAAEQLPPRDRVDTAVTWNSQERFGVLGVNDRGFSFVQTVNLDYGVTPENFRDSALWWRQALLRLRSTLGRRLEEATLSGNQ